MLHDIHPHFKWKKYYAHKQVMTHTKTEKFGDLIHILSLSKQFHISNKQRKKYYS